ncbi:hypothetical protein [Thermotoga sp. KOL6]|uniref:HD domain-containing protein n=1 Tax=Thermotoga sp. KOL6 TaxID=126741 RepID=UPI000C79502E|nr:hypothetical protein [Thermotoga sp. KOL6]PLV58073.1 hypothetical protein AS005_08680 [Thermotoga sp. KOL6]
MSIDSFPKIAFLKFPDNRQLEIHYDPKLGFSLSFESAPLDDVSEKVNVTIVYENHEVLFENINLLEAIRITKNFLKSPALMICPAGINILNKRNDNERLLYLEKIKEILNSSDFYLEKVKRIRSMKEAGKKNLSPEESLLTGVIEKGFVVDEIVIIGTPNEGKEERYKHLVFLEHSFRSYFNVEKIEIEHIEFYPNREETYSVLFTELWRTLQKIISRTKKTTIINATSSYKIITSLLTIMMLYFKKSGFYTFEKSNNILEIPSFGLDWNYSYLDEIMPQIKALKSGKSSFLEITEELQGIYLDGKTSYYPLEEIERLYHEKRDVPFDYGGKYIEVLDNEELKSYLESGVKKRWTHMWIGDQIPETVEHSQRHSRRLMNLAYHTMRVMGLNRFANLKNPDQEYIDGISYLDLFLFLLGISIYVHDLGHVYPILKVKNREYILEGFPPLIRDLHSELTVSLIESGEYNVLAEEKPFDSESKSLRDIFKEKTKEIVEAVKLICRYHRRNLPIEDDFMEEKRLMKIFNLDTNPLVEVVLNKITDENLQEVTVRAAKWLQFIDGLDVQADRVITDSYQKMRVERTANEISYLQKKIEGKKLSIPHGDAKKIEQLLKDIFSLKDKILSSDKNVAKEIESKAKELEKVLYEAAEKDIERFLKSSEAEIVSKIAFKARQFVHFNKHRAVSSIMPVMFRNNTLFIKIFPNPSFNMKDELQKIKEDIEEEHKRSHLKDDFEIEVIINERN